MHQLKRKRGWSLTAGLKRPPDILKNTQTLTAKEKPEARLIYTRVDAFGAVDIELFTCVRPPLSTVAAASATCAAPKPRNRNIKVPVNSAIMAINSFRTLFGRYSLGPG